MKIYLSLYKKQIILAFSTLIIILAYCELITSSVAMYILVITGIICLTLGLNAEYNRVRVPMEFKNFDGECLKIILLISVGIALLYKYILMLK